jgi:hypothetical protein
LYATGLRSKEIAYLLGLAKATVDVYIRDLAIGVRVSGRRELAVWALQNQGCFVPETWVPTGIHKEGCGCDSIYCTAMRVAGSDAALAEYKKRRDELRAKEKAADLVEVAPPEDPAA